jgi:hypothetical protein
VTSVYIADVGFRSAGVRLVTPVRTAEGRHTLTLAELIATPDGTDLTYYLTGLTGDEGYTPRQDVVAIRSAGVEHVLTRGAFSFNSDSARLRRRISSTSVIPPWTGPVAVAISITGVGEFQLAAELRPFGPESDAPRRDVNASATHEGITVTVRGVGAAREETAVEIEVAVGEGECCAGIGAYRGHRPGPTALSLTDESGRAYMERWQEPGRFDHATLALFQPLHPEAREVELAVPYVFVEDAAATTETLPLPVTSPVETRLGRYEIRVLSTARIPANPRARAPLSGARSRRRSKPRRMARRSEGAAPRTASHRRRLLQHRVSPSRAGHETARARRTPRYHRRSDARGNDARFHVPEHPGSRALADPFLGLGESRRLPLRDRLRA